MSRHPVDAWRVGGQSAIAPLQRVLVRPPRGEDLRAWREYGWWGEPDPAKVAVEHRAFQAALGEVGAEVVLGTAPVPGDPDAVYACDPGLVTDRGVVLLCPGKGGRRREPEALALDLERAEVPVVDVMAPPATAEGGDLLWLDRETLLVGRSYRTNDHGVAWLRTTLPWVRVISFDLPHHRGRGEVLHLLSLISLLDVDLAVAYLPLLPAPLVELLEQRGIRIVEVPEAEFGSDASNVLALGPRVALMLEGNPTTRRRLEDAGVDVRTYAGDELSRKGRGGPTCLALPLLRREG